MHCGPVPIRSPTPINGCYSSGNMWAVTNGPFSFPATSLKSVRHICRPLCSQQPFTLVQTLKPVRPSRRSDPHRSDLYGTVTDAVIQIRSTGLQSANKDCKPVWTLEGSFQDIICLGDTTSKARPAFGSFQKVSRIAYHTTPPWVETDTPSLQNPNFS